MDVYGNSSENITAQNLTDAINPCLIIHQYLHQYFGLSTIAAVILILLSFLERRRGCGRSYCFGRPGCLTPVNLLDGDDDPLGYAAAFGSTASGVFSLFTGASYLFEQSSFNPWLLPFIIMASAFDLGLQYYPLFTCIQYKRSIVMSLVGFCYGGFMLFMNILESSVCNNESDILLQIPVSVCLGFLCLKFSFNFTMTVLERIRIRRGMMRIVTKERTYPEEYVKHLLEYEPDPSVETTGAYIKLQQTLSNLKLCYQNRWMYRCTQRTLSIYVVACLLLYQWLVFFKEVGDLLREGFRNTIDFLLQSNNTDIAAAERAVNVIEGSFYVAVVVSSLLAVLSMILLYVSHHRHIRMLLKGDNSFIPKACRSIAPHETLARSWMFAGSQIGHLIWGYIMNCLALMFIGIILSYGLILPLAKKAPDYFLTPLRTLLPSVVITQATLFALYLISTRFLQKADVYKKGKVKFKRVLALTNRRVLHNLSYFLFFFYVPLGLVKSIRRNIVSLFCGLAFLGRLDRCILMQGLENLDNGYLSYISFLQVEISHCNPIVVTFCNLLIQEVHSKYIRGNSRNESMTSELMEATYHDTDIISQYDPKVLKRWHKCYTLVNNSDICSTSKRYTKDKEKRALNGDVKRRPTNHSVYGAIA